MVTALLRGFKFRFILSSNYKTNCELLLSGLGSNLSRIIVTNINPVKFFDSICK